MLRFHKLQELFTTKYKQLQESLYLHIFRTFLSQDLNFIIVILLLNRAAFNSTCSIHKDLT